MESADDDLMKVVLSPPVFTLLDDLRSLDQLKTFKEILSSAVDKDEDYCWLVDQGMRSLLHPELLGLKFCGQSIGVLTDLIAEFERRVGRHTGRWNRSRRGRTSMLV